MTTNDPLIEQLAAAWLESERRVEAEGSTPRHLEAARDTALRYDEAVRAASVEDLRLAWEAARKLQADCLVGSAAWGEARRVATLLQTEYEVRRDTERASPPEAAVGSAAATDPA